MSEKIEKDASGSFRMKVAKPRIRETREDLLKRIEVLKADLATRGKELYEARESAENSRMRAAELDAENGKFRLMLGKERARKKIYSGALEVALEELKERS